MSISVSDAMVTAALDAFLSPNPTHSTTVTPQRSRMRDAVVAAIRARPNSSLLSTLREIEEFLDNQADADDGIPNKAMSLLVEVRAAISSVEAR